MKKNEEDYHAAAYENRLIVLLEDIDEGTFSQVVLNPMQFKQVSNAISRGRARKDHELREGFEEVELKLMGEWPADQFNGVQSSYTQAEIEAMENNED